MRRCSLKTVLVQEATAFFVLGKKKIDLGATRFAPLCSAECETPGISIRTSIVWGHSLKPCRTFGLERVHFYLPCSLPRMSTWCSISNINWEYGATCYSFNTVLEMIERDHSMGCSIIEQLLVMYWTFKSCENVLKSVCVKTQISAFPSAIVYLFSFVQPEVLGRC